MLCKTLVLLLIGLLGFVSPVAAANGTLAMAPSEDWAVPLSDAEMGDLRGGFAGLAFSVFFTGWFDKLGNAAGNLTVDTGGATSAPPPTFSVQNGQVNIQTVIGNFQGASGFFQITQVPGSFNIVHNNLFVQIAIINIQNAGSIPSLMSLLR